MGIWTMLLTGIGLSMDAFAVSVCKGLGMRNAVCPSIGDRIVFWRFSGIDANAGLLPRYAVCGLYPGV